MNGATETVTLTSGMLRLADATTVTLSGGTDKILEASNDKVTGVLSSNNTVAATGTGNTTSFPLGTNNVTLSSPQLLIDAMASFAPPDAATMASIMNAPASAPVVLATNLH